MGFNNDRYFFLSGAISFALFGLLLLLIGYSVLTSSKIQQFAMTQSEFVSVSIAIAEPRKESKSETIPEPLTTPVEEPVEQKQEQEQEKTPDISDLFSQVKSEKNPKIKEQDTKRLETLNALEKQLSATSDKSQFSEKVQNLKLAKPSVKVMAQGGSSGPIVNEYHAKIQGIIYDQFHPPAGSEGQAARVRIKIGPSGKLISYKVLAYSGNSALNNEVDWLKERLGMVLFPPHPEGKEAVLECILTTKE